MIMFLSRGHRGALVFCCLAAVCPAEDAPVTPPVSGNGAGWIDWRGGPRRDGISEFIPARLPAMAPVAWRKPMTGPGMAGIAVSPPYVIVADKSEDGNNDLWRCLDAETGRERWTFAYAAPGAMDYTNTPRATPVIRGGKAYLLGALGHLHCVELATGKPLWKRNLLADFGGTRPTWGCCASPLVDGDRLIFGTASPDAALVALNRHTGVVLWQTPGKPTAHAGMLLDTFGGRRQIVGYDAVSAGGWDPETGKRLWTLTPPVPGDFNVPTPLNSGGRLLLATENNGTRLYGFDPDGTIRPAPLASSEAFKPDASTPVLVNGLLFGFVNDSLVCLDPRDRLATRWRADGDGWGTYASLIGGAGRVLATTTNGRLLLFAAEGGAFRLISSLRVFDRKNPEVWSHPALWKDRLYLRSGNEAVCMRLKAGDERGR